MDHLKIGFLGCGNMTSAMIKGLVNSPLLPAGQILVFDRKPAVRQLLAETYGVISMQTDSDLASAADILIVAVKPDVILDSLAVLKTELTIDKIVVSVAAGITLQALSSVLNPQQKIVRVMPNTPALVGEGMSSVTPNAEVTDKETNRILAIFRSFGKAEVVKESLIHSVIGISGSAPAYVFMMIEAMADAAVLGGLPREQAYVFSAQAVKGAARMVLENDLHPAALKDMVCSPGGTTIEAVKTLENEGFRSAILNAIKACMDKSEALSRR